MLNIGKVKPTVNMMSISVSNDMRIHKDAPTPCIYESF